MDLQGRDLRIDMTGDDVELLQNELRQLGFQIHQRELRSRKFGTSTLRAVQEFVPGK